jgi:glutamate synthase (NADPH/NADH) small chain
LASKTRRHRGQKRARKTSIRQSGDQAGGNQGSTVTAVECLKYELGEPDDSGRRIPVPIEGSEFTLDVDTVIIAIGNVANPLIRQTTPGLEFNKWGNIVVDENCKTSMGGVYGGGDIVLGTATVILTMGQGRIAAAAMNKYLEEKKAKNA